MKCISLKSRMVFICECVPTKNLKQDGLSIDGYTSENDNFGPEHIVYPLEKSLFLTEFSILPQKTCKTQKTQAGRAFYRWLHI